MIGIDEECSSARISRYESGVHQPPFETVERIASALKVPTPYFYCRSDALAGLLLAVRELTASELEKLTKAAQRMRRGK